MGYGCPTPVRGFIADRVGGCESCARNQQVEIKGREAHRDSGHWSHNCGLPFEGMCETRRRSGAHVLGRSRKPIYETSARHRNLAEASSGASVGRRNVFRRAALACRSTRNSVGFRHVRSLFQARPGGRTRGNSENSTARPELCTARRMRPSVPGFRPESLPVVCSERFSGFVSGHGFSHAATGANERWA